MKEQIDTSNGVTYFRDFVVGVVVVYEKHETY